MKISIPLWWINKWLRFSGFRIFYLVTLTEDEIEDPSMRIGIMWWGNPFSMTKEGWTESKLNPLDTGA